MTTSMANAFKAESVEERDERIAEDGKNEGCLSGMNATGIFVKDDIFNPMQPVFNRPMAAPKVQEVG